MKNPKIQNLKAFSLRKDFRGRPAFFVQLWWIVQSTLFACSPQFMFGWRRFLLIIFGAKIGVGVKIRSSAKITFPWKLEVGEYVWIGDNAVLYSLGSIKIGPHSVISQRSYLCAASHDYSDINFSIFEDGIIVGREVWIATDVFIAPGVVVGDGAVVGARSSVFSSLPPNMISVGSPAKPYKERVRVA